MLVKEDNVGEFSDYDEIRILDATMLMKNNYIFLKILALWIKWVLK